MRIQRVAAAATVILASAAVWACGSKDRNAERVAKVTAKAAETAKKQAEQAEDSPPPAPPPPPAPFVVSAEWGAAAAGEQAPPHVSDDAVSPDAELRDRLLALAYKPPNKHTVRIVRDKGAAGVAGVLAATWHGSDRVRAQAVRLLTKLEFDHALAVDPLKRVLRMDRNPDARAAAAAALVDLQIPALGDALVDVLSKDKDESARANAAWALGKLGHARAQAALIAGLRDPATWVRIRSATALGRVKGKGGVKGLNYALGDPNAEVRKSAARALKKLTGRTHKPTTPRLSP